MAERFNKWSNVQVASFILVGTMAIFLLIRILITPDITVTSTDVMDLLNNWIIKVNVVAGMSILFMYDYVFGESWAIYQRIPNGKIKQ